ncbi:MAG TPA: hypothetical protein VKB54_03755 [Solirubrobacteraceae bacterium]|nr:hypothetical protein [Solirubrobacteraceae bacterium]
MTAIARRLVVVLLAAGVVAAACVTGDRGAARAAVGSATGPLVSSSLANTAILSARGLRPGDAKAGEVTVQNVGDQAGAFALSSGGIADGSVPLSGALDLSVQDITPGRGSAVLYSGKLGALPSVGLGTLAEGELRRYRFTVALPASVGDAYQGASTSASFVWTATGVGAAPAPAPPAQPAPVPAAPKPAPKPAPRASLVARARQAGVGGTVSMTVACDASCRAVVAGTVVDGRTKVRVPTFRRTLTKRTRIRLSLPPRARTALSRGRTISVRLRLQATMGTRTVTVRSTVAIARRAR